MHGSKVLQTKAARVKATWQPGLKPKNEPVSLAFPNDIERLQRLRSAMPVCFERWCSRRVRAPTTRVWAPRLSPKRTRLAMFAQAQNGRTFDITVRPKDDVLAELEQKIDDLARLRSLEPAAAEALQSAVLAFKNQFRTAIQAYSG